MKGKKVFATLFEADDIHLVKDVGMIPRTMAENFGYRSVLVTSHPCNFSEGDFETVVFNRRKSELRNQTLFVRKYAKSIDVLNVYHLRIKSYILIKLYKRRNKRGKTYLKLDMDCDFLQDKNHGKFIKRRLFVKCLKAADVVSAESTEVCRAVEKYSGRRAEYIPDGTYPLTAGEEILKKKKTVLTVGRLGTEQKNAELLAEAFAGADPEGWELRLVGPYTDKFAEYIENLVKGNPSMRGRIRLEGEITDREKLQQIYSEAAVFALPSRWESFGIALAEAAKCGCYLIASDRIPAAKDMIENGRFGEIFKSDDVDALAAAIKRAAVSDAVFGAEAIKERAASAAEKFDWVKICAKLDKLLSGGA